MNIEEAATSAGFPLPPAAQPIGAYREDGIDRLVAFAVRLPPAALPGVLEASGFTVDLRPGHRVFQKPVSGVDIDGAKSFAGGQDRQRVNERELVRDVLVVTDDPEATVLNVWAFTT